MKKDVNITKGVFIVIILVVVFIIVIYEASKVTKKDSEYIQYKEKYNGLVNQINYREVTEVDMAKKYLSDFVEISIEDRQKAYELIDDYYKENAVKTYAKFNKKMDIIMTPLYMNAKLVKYALRMKGNNRVYFVEDAAGNTLIFKEKSIMDYTVYLDASTVDL